MQSKYWKLFWVVLLMISSFTLGYTLKQATDAAIHEYAVHGQRL